MKKIVLIQFMLLSLMVNAQNVNIPDANFKTALVAHGNTINGVGASKIDTNNDGEIQLSEANNYTGSIILIRQNIADFTGLEEFTKITRFYGIASQLNTIDLSANIDLILIDLNTNSIANIDVSKNISLETFVLRDNNLSSLDVSKNTKLELLICDQNQIATLDVSNNTNLEYLSVQNNNLTSINLLSNIELTDLLISGNKLSAIDLTANLKLDYLAVDRNQLTALDVSVNTVLETINCRNNAITSLDVSSNSSLKSLYCDNNNLTSLNAANGNNGLSTSTLYQMWATKNPNLTCIQHDIGFDPTTTPSFSGWIKDDSANWSNNCGTASTPNFNQIDLKIYPNPTSSSIQIQLNQVIKKGAIFNLIGKKVKNITSKNIDISSLQIGVYVLKIETESGRIAMKKIIKN